LRIKVRFFTVLREVTGKKEEALEILDKDITVGMILQVLARRYGKAFENYIFDQQTGKVKGFLQFFVNGQSASTLNGFETKLQEGDTLAIVPPVGGG
jgi:molybdopterin synthase sulfur carrier subunit